MSGTTEKVIDRAGNKEALDLWLNVTLENIKNVSYDLSARQIALLLVVYKNEGNHTVRGLSNYMGISKPAICRAVDTLSKYDLVQRVYDENDRRNVFIKPTEKGYEFLGSFSENIMNSLMAIS